MVLYFLFPNPLWRSNVRRPATGPPVTAPAQPVLRLSTRHYVHSQTAGEVAGWLLANYSDQYLKEDDRKAIQAMVEEYFAANPAGTVVLGNYTPRGRKRRGLRTKQRRLLCVKLGNTRHYLPGLTYRVNTDITVQTGRVTVQCHCKGVNRAHIPLTTVLWPAAS